VLKDLFNNIQLVDKADDPPFGSPQGGERVEPHLALALGTGKGIGLIDLSDEVGPALFCLII